MKRNPVIVRGRIIQTIILALFAGAVYWKLPKPDEISFKLGGIVDVSVKDIMNKAGFLFFVSVNQLMMALIPVFLTFPSERGVFLKEENSKLYRISTYFTGSIFIYYIKNIFLNL